MAQLHQVRGTTRIQALGVSWTQVWLTLAVPGRHQRHALLRLAVAGHWTDRQLRLTAQQLFPSNRRGVGGRRPKAFPAHGPEAAVRELGRLCRRLHDFHSQAWAPIKKEEWRGLVSKWPRDERERLRRLLTGAAEKARQAATACEDARRTLAEILRRLGPQRGGRGWAGLPPSGS
jgi:hypothetical protein